MYTIIGFDSILVRLKVNLIDNNVAGSDVRFHTGSIKSQPRRAHRQITQVSIPYWFD